MKGIFSCLILLFLIVRCYDDKQVDLVVHDSGSQTQVLSYNISDSKHRLPEPPGFLPLFGVEVEIDGVEYGRFLFFDTGCLDNEIELIRNFDPKYKSLYEWYRQTKNGDFSPKPVSAVSFDNYGQPETRINFYNCIPSNWLLNSVGTERFSFIYEFWEQESY